MRLLPAAEDCSAFLRLKLSLIAARVFGHLIVASFQVSNISINFKRWPPTERVAIAFALMKCILSNLNKKQNGGHKFVRRTIHVASPFLLGALVMETKHVVFALKLDISVLVML